MRPAFQSDRRPRSATSASQAFVSGLTAQPQQIETPEKRTREVLWLWIGLVFGVLTFFGAFNAFGQNRVGTGLLLVVAGPAISFLCYRGIRKRRKSDSSNQN